MVKLFMERFGLTESGAKSLKKAAIIEFFCNLINMAPVIITMMVLENLLLDGNWKNPVILISSVITLVIMTILYFKDYDAIYMAVYSESENIRVEMADALRKLPLSYFSKHDLSDVSQTIMADVEALEHALGHAMTKISGYALFFPVLAIMLLIGNVKLGLAVLIPVLLSILMIILSKKIQIKGNSVYYKILREQSEAFQETIEMQKEIKSFGLKEKVKKQLYEKMEYSEKMHLKTEIPLVISVLLSGFIVQISLAIVIVTGSALYLNGEINILYLIGYIIIGAKVKDMMDGVSAFLAEIFYLDARIKRIKEIWNAEVQEGIDCELDNYNIKLENVSFAYDEDTPVLKGLSFKANANEVTALVGLSGSGKTSVLRLISRLYDYDNGHIYIGDKDIKGISTDSLFKKVSIVFQDVTLFNDTVMENIRLGRKDASDSEVIEAAKLAGCDDFVRNLKDGYETAIGENGASLSGGERQRISIARAILKDAPIIILDEIMAALDVENEKKIQEGLTTLIKDKTVIIISHRMKSIENVNKIVLINNGVAEGIGTHNELLKASKTYESLVEKATLAESFKY